MTSWHKTSSSSRGYGAAWRRKRKQILLRDGGLCQVCRRAGFITQATEVDHIMSRAECKRLGVNSEIDENLQSICHPCHEKKTTEENGGTYGPRPVTGADGWPV
jgi:5-methylcytosine-specific restriction enzyme A